MTRDRTYSHDFGELSIQLTPDRQITIQCNPKILRCEGRLVFELIQLTPGTFTVRISGEKEGLMSINNFSTVDNAEIPDPPANKLQKDIYLRR